MASEKKQHIVKLGIFVFIGTALLIAGVFAIGDKQQMFSKTMDVYAYFNNVQGLRTGAAVRLSGINVGNVFSIKITSDKTGRVEVGMSLVEDVKHLIRKNTTATVETEGIVGNQIVTLTLHGDDAPLIQPGDSIEAVDPVGMSQLIGEFEGTLENVKQMSAELNEIVAKVNDGDGTIGKLLNDDELYAATTNLVTTADVSLQTINTKIDTLAGIINNLGYGVNSIIGNIDSVIVSVDSVLADIRAGKGLAGMLISGDGEMNSSIAVMLDNMVKTSEEVKLGAARFAENMEALKRNWLFKAYFEERGYYEKTPYEKQLDEYLEEINSRIEALDEKIGELESATAD